ncbi:hypothetical protein BD779DRAFT_1501881 [Infundibulicybe gibba]|nr:hypothetical protein BD779DRAFT_1501881 [Infundibulicybe gibba]
MADKSRSNGLPRTPRSRAVGGPGSDRIPRGEGGGPSLPHRAQGARSINNVPSKSRLMKKTDNLRGHLDPDPLDQRGIDTRSRSSEENLSSLHSHQRAQLEATEEDYSALQGYSQAKSESYRGLDIWSRVATVASTLTISVSQAWATNISIDAGEETPPGADSRLTRAMKAYHLDRARHPTDLPSWLFEEHERRPSLVNKTPDPGREDRRDTIGEGTGGQGREYLAARILAPAIPSSTSQHTHQSGTDRLRALRDKKRSPAGSNALKPDTTTDGVVTRKPFTPQRVGLPSGPATKPRQV